MDTSNIGKKIKSRRIELNMTQKDLANSLHISNQLISKWETCESVPTLDYIEKLCNVLNLSFNELIGEEKPKSKKLTFDKTMVKPLIISAVVFFAIALIVMFSLLTYYVFIPNAKKDNAGSNGDNGETIDIDKYEFIANINKSIQTTVENNDFYNIELVGELDGDETSKITIQGYFDDNGNVCYYNSKLEETVKDNKMVTGYYKSYYTKPSNIINLQDLFTNQLESLDDDNYFNFDDLTHIRKTDNGYYVEFSDEYFTRDLSNNEKKNYQLTDKIKGEVIITDNCFVSMNIIIKYINKPTNEPFTKEKICNFKEEKPNIILPNNTETRIESMKILSQEFIDSFKGGENNNYNKNDMIYLSMPNQNIYISQNGNYCYINRYDDEIIYFDSTTFKTIKKEEMLRSKKEFYLLIFQNGYIYSISGNNVTFYNEDLTTKSTITFNDNVYMDTLYFYNGFAYSANRMNTDYFTSNISLVKYNLNTGHGEYFKYLNCDENDFKISYNKNYIYWQSGVSEGNVYDIDTDSTIIDKKSDCYIRYVDLKGNIYHSTSSNDHTLYYNSEKLSGEFWNGDIYETDELIFVVNSSIIYVYHDGALIENMVSLKDTHDQQRSIGEGFCYLDDSKIFITEEESISIELLFIDDIIFRPDDRLRDTNIKILEVVDDKILVGFCSPYNEIIYLGYYKIDDLTLPLQVIKVNSVITRYYGNNCILYFADSENNEFVTCFKANIKN